MRGAATTDSTTDLSTIGARLLDTPQWYAVHTHRREERRAEQNLRAWGVETFMPLMRERRRTRRHEPAFVIQPMFPQYLFACFSAPTLLAKVAFTRGVHTVVSFGGTPVSIAPMVVDALRQRMGPAGWWECPDQLAPGDRLEIEDGPLRHLVGIFEGRVSGTDRVRLLLTAMGCGARLTLPRAALRRVAV